MIGIVVQDMTAALRFYRTLGLDIPAAADTESHVEITANGYRIAWDTAELMRSIVSDWVQPTGHRISIAYRCDSPKEVDALYQRVTSAGYKGRKEPWNALWGQRYAMVLDPDGNNVDLFAPLQ
jgi:uncharacterized glyoxalase superfamily protein PhnB